MIYISRFLEECDSAANLMGIIGFVNDYLDDFIKFVSKYEFGDSEIESLLPESQRPLIADKKNELIRNLMSIREKVNGFKQDYYDSDNNEKKVLDVLLEEGVFPTYSFPRNVVGFSIEDYKGENVEQEPDRALDMAISEYAPGRLIVVNKKTYKSGGIYNFHSKFDPETGFHPASKYMNSREYNRIMFYCSNPSCNWVSYNDPGSECPFCRQPSISSQNVIKPWGFAPINGTNIREAEADAELSYAELPSYAMPIKDEEMTQSGTYRRLRYGRLVDQPMTILNQGPDRNGFTICADCGAAIPGNDVELLSKIGQPYRNPRVHTKCDHPMDKRVNAFLGHQFNTDMVLMEISLDKSKIDTELDSLWIESAALTLAEAVVLAAGNLLDVEFNDLKSGYRIRQMSSSTCVDIYLFDSLSSGAGYSSMLAGRTTELLEETYKVLDCKNGCNSACHDCLKHYWNQRVHNKLDRHSARQLLEWAKDESLPSTINFSEQVQLLKGIKETALLDSDFEIIIENHDIWAKSEHKRKKLFVYPAMLNKNCVCCSNEGIAISDKMVLKAMPYAYTQIRRSM